MGRNDEKTAPLDRWLGYRLKFGQSDQDQRGPKFFIPLGEPAYCRGTRTRTPIKVRVPVRLAIDQKEARQRARGLPLGAGHLALNT